MPFGQFFSAEIFGQSDRDRATIYQNLRVDSADFVARFGGEEFIVILPSIQPEGLVVVAERLKQAIDHLNITHDYSNASNIVTVSMGLAWVEPDKSYLPTEIIAAADEALYSAKDAGRNRRSEVVVVEHQLVFSTS